MAYVNKADQQAPSNTENTFREMLYSANRHLSALRSEFDEISTMLPSKIRSELLEANNEKVGIVTNIRNEIWTLGEQWFSWTE